MEELFWRSCSGRAVLEKLLCEAALQEQQKCDDVAFGKCKIDRSVAFWAFEAAKVWYCRVWEA